MRHLYLCPLRWADMDSLGHVNNVTYVDYLQEARVEMLAVHPGDTAPTGLSRGVVVVRHEVDFVHPLVYRPGPVRIETWVTKIGAASATLRYEIFDDTPGGERTIYARALTVLAPFDFAAQRPRRLSPDEREVLGSFLEPDAAPAPALG